MAVLQPCGCPATVAARSDPGPREVNEDRSFTALSAEDGSWVIAVADGLGGLPRGAEAAEAAVAALPSRIASEADMAQAFVAAHRAVAALAPSPTAWRSSPERCPMTTLCVAAWTPEGGLVVAHAGDTLPFLVGWRDPARADGGLLGVPHRNPFGGLQSCLGADVPCTKPDLGGAELSLVTVQDDDGEFALAVARESDFESLIPALSAGEWAVVMASDGVWEKFLPGPDDADGYGVYDVCERIVVFVGPAGSPAGRIAEGLLAAARDRGLDDNATVAVARMARVGRAS